MRLAALCAVVAALSALVGGTVSAFSDTTENGTSTFAAANSFGCTTPGTATVDVAADTFVWEKFATTAYGSATHLSVQASPLGSDSRTLLRFTLPAAPSGCTVTAATLRLFDYNPTPGRTLDVQRADTPWDEGATTWSTKPNAIGTPSSAPAPSAAAWVEWDVGQHMPSLYAGDDDGFLVKDADEVNVSANQSQLFYSRESTDARKPQLVLTFG